RFDSAGPARDNIRATGAPIVVKADGLAAGKGVIVAMTEAEALAAIDDMFGGAFGAVVGRPCYFVKPLGADNSNGSAGGPHSGVFSAFGVSWVAFHFTIPLG
ncbi:hypothetical protein LCGC14_1359390, partial [marine sediment metagenome]